MNGSQNDGKDTMLQELIVHEEQKIRESGAGGLSADRIAAIKARIHAEKDQILADFDKTSPLGVRARAARSRAWLPLSAAALLAIAVGVLFLLPRQKEIAVDLAYSLGGAQLTGKVVNTGAKSMAMTRIGDYAVIAQGQNARLQVQLAQEQSGRAEIRLTAEQGFVFFSVPKGRSEISVSTPTGSVRVTGTSFAVESLQNGTAVQVLEGSVEATSGDATGKTAIVSAGQKIHLTPKQHQVQVGVLTEAENKRLRLYHRMTNLAVQQDIKAAADALVAEIAQLEKIHDTLKPGESGGAQRLTLAEIKAKYGKVSRVNLKNGKSYTGFFQLKGAQMEIITPSGTVRVPTAELQDVQDM